MITDGVSQTLLLRGPHAPLSAIAQVKTRSWAAIDKKMVGAIRARTLSALEVLEIVFSMRDLPKASRLAWSQLTEDPAFTWTGLCLLADRLESEVVRRAAPLGAGFEAVQLGLRRDQETVCVCGPVGVGQGQRSALHHAVLALLDTFARTGAAEFREPEPQEPGWSPASDLIERADPIQYPPSPVVPLGHLNDEAGIQLLTDSLEDAALRAAAQEDACDMQAQTATQKLARAKSARAIIEKSRAGTERLREAADQLKRESEELTKSGLPVPELRAAAAALKQRHEALLQETSDFLRTRMMQTGATELLFEKVAPGHQQWEFRGEPLLSGEVEGQRLWAGQVSGRHAEGRLPCEGTVAQQGAEGWHRWQGPLRESPGAAQDAVANLAWCEIQDGCVPDPYASGSWPGFVIPEKSAPALAALADSGILRAFACQEEGSGDSCRAEMSCWSGGVRLSVSAGGPSADEAREACARRMLGVLAAETGFGDVPWPADEAEGRLEELAREPWLKELRRRSWPGRGGGRMVEASCVVDGVAVRAQAVAEEESVAARAAAWLLIRHLGRGRAYEVLDTRSRSAAVLESLRERDVVESVEVCEGPGGAEAYVASARVGERCVWAAGVHPEQALGGLLAAVRCWAMAPGTAETSKVGEVRPGWVRRRSWAGTRIESPVELRELLAEGPRLCVAGVADNRSGFVVMPRSGGRGAASSGGGSGWRVWTERGAVRVSGPLVPVALLAQAVVGCEREAAWDPSVTAWADILRFGCQAVAAGQVWPGVRGDGRVVWRPGPWSDDQAQTLHQLVAALPPWAHSAAVGSGKGAMLSAGTTAGLVLEALADELVRGPGTAAVWGPCVLTSVQGAPAEGVVGQWLDAVEEIADALPPPGVVLSVQPPPRPRQPAATLKVQIRFRPAGKAGKLMTLPALEEQLGAEHPAVLRALRALRKAAGCWPVLEAAVRGRADQVRVSPAEASLLLGHLGRALRRAGIEVEWPQRWATRLRPVVVADGPQSMLSMQELVDYRWQIRLDGTVLSPEECVRVADAAGTLIWLRDRWFLIDAVTAERARGGRLRQAVPAGEALTAVLLGSISVGDDEHAELVAEGDLGRLGVLLSGDASTPVEPPRALAGKLWPYQQEGLTWLAAVTSRFGALLCDDMGLGKSVQAIALILHRREQGLAQGLPVLVVVPTSMMLTWVRQLERFAPGVPVRMYHGPGRTMEGLEPDTVVVTSYGTVLASQDDLAAHTYAMVVADEAQHVKNSSSKSFRALARLLALSRVVLTGTPIENQLGDLWALLNWTNPSVFASLTSFRQAFGALEAGPTPEVAAALNRVVGPFLLRRHKSDPYVALQLPDRIDSVHTLELTPAQTGLYTRTVEMALDQLRTAKRSERSGLVLRLLTHLRQICNAPAHLRVGAADSGRLEAALADHQGGQDSCKLNALDELVPSIIDGGEPITVFTEFRTMAALLRHHAASWGVKPLLHVGGMTSGERDASLDAFRRHKSRLLIATYKSGGTGLDLTAANHAILFDRPFNPARVAQAIDRVHRPGQESDVHVHTLTVAGTVESKIDGLLARKAELLNSLDTQATLNPALLTDEELHALVALGTAS